LLQSFRARGACAHEQIKQRDAGDVPVAAMPIRDRHCELVIVEDVPTGTLTARRTINLE
jgi:hypothetical protein